MEHTLLGISLKKKKKNHTMFSQFHRQQCTLQCSLQGARYTAYICFQTYTHSMALSHLSHLSPKCLLGFWFSLSFPHVLLQKLKHTSQQNRIERGLWHNLLGKGSLIWQHSCAVLLPESQLHWNHLLPWSLLESRQTSWVLSGWWRWVLIFTSLN